MPDGMEPKIEVVNSKKLVGIYQRMSFADYNIFPLWSGFMPRRKEIKNAVMSANISMTIYATDYFSNFRPANQFDKWAAVEVINFDDVPIDMKTFILPDGLYAIFHYVGANSDHSFFNYIFKTWLPNSKYELDDRPHFEVMGEKYKNNDPTSEEDIFIPIKLRR